MSTLIIALIILILALLSLSYYRKQKGSCGDCQCSCPVKDQMSKHKP
ncbi:FeoB-associated Cys-rich membrane protein [Streptococcus iniae]|nr:FeoB-associated Cys-rich membrane protein [Streptococcus iniae]RLV26904.1 FeoB-associated Cys-rich membrane protein [Streptococcus iniae]